MAAASPSRIAQYIGFIIRHRWLVIAGSLALAFSVGSGASRIGLSSNYRTFFGPDNPDLFAFEAMEDTFTKNDGVLVVNFDHCPAVQDRHEAHRVQPVAWRAGADAKNIEDRPAEFSRMGAVVAHEGESVLTELGPSVLGPGLGAAHGQQGGNALYPFLGAAWRDGEGNTVAGGPLFGPFVSFVST